MGFIKKHAFVIAAIFIIVLFFVSRFYNILGLPIFTDEAIYIRWSQIAKADAAWRFISLTDGKQPLFVWITMIVLAVIKDPLLAGRLVSVIAGLFSLIGLFFLSYELFKNKKIALLTSLLYVLFPFALVYDRLALYDSLVSAFVIWTLYIGVLLVRKIRLDLALIFGMVAGLGMLAKTSANFGLILLPFSLLLFNFRDKKRKTQFLKWFGFALIAVIIANAMYLILRLSPFYHIITEKNYLFIYSPQEWLQHPFSYFIGNIRVLFEWLVTYSTVPFLILVVSAFLVGKKNFKEKVLLFLWFLVPFVALSLFGKLLYPRYILFMSMPLLILGAYALYHMLLFSKKFWLKIVVLVVFLILFIVNDYFIITDFVKASVPRSDKGQYLAGWPAGVGVMETVAFLQEKSQQGKIYVGTEGTFGLMPYALEIYLHDNPNITVKGFWPIGDTPPKEILSSAKKIPTYFIFYQDCPSCPNTGKAPIGWSLTPVLQLERLEPGSFYTLYQVKSQ